MNMCICVGGRNAFQALGQNILNDIQCVNVLIMDSLHMQIF